MGNVMLTLLEQQGDTYLKYTVCCQRRAGEDPANTSANQFSKFILIHYVWQFPYGCLEDQRQLSKELPISATMVTDATSLL